MNTLNSKGIIVGSYSYDFHILSWTTSYKSSEFTIEGIDNCTFTIDLCETQKLSSFQLPSFQLSVKKSNERRALAKITVLWDQEVITKIVDDWTDICLLKEPFSTAFITVRVFCEIVWYGTIEDSSTIQAPLNLSPNFKDFHLQSSLSDLQISVSGEELFAHKVILAAHSPVFLSMFETDMKEKRENRIVIEGIELNVMKIVLSIMYTGYDKGLDEVEMAKKVLVVAERYDMKPLKKLCESKLLQKLEVSNVMEILEEAENSNAETLHAECVNFIVRNKEKMAKSKDWETFCHRQPRTMCSLLKKFTTT